jgi:hypothetical protein
VRELQTTLRLLRALLGIALWCAGTAWLGATTIWRTGVLLSRFKTISAQVRLCPRGHEVPMYGLFECGCGARIESWVFAPCPICRESAGYTPCPICGLPVRNPLLP